MNIPAKIRQLREAKGYSQAEFATKAELSANYISLLESGKKSPTLKSLEKISKALDIPFPILSFLSLDEEDIAPDKRDAFQLLNPAVQAMLERFFITPILE